MILQSLVSSWEALSLHQSGPTELSQVKEFPLSWQKNVTIGNLGVLIWVYAQTFRKDIAQNFVRCVCQKTRDRGSRICQMLCYSLLNLRDPPLNWSTTSTAFNVRVMGIPEWPNATPEQEGGHYVPSSGITKKMQTHSPNIGEWKGTRLRLECSVYNFQMK